MGMLNLRDVRSFASISTFLKVKGLQRRYADSTLEDYVWRLLRVLRNTKPAISPIMIAMYYDFWISVGGVQKAR